MYQITWGYCSTQVQESTTWLCRPQCSQSGCSQDEGATTEGTTSSAVAPASASSSSTSCQSSWSCSCQGSWGCCWGYWGKGKGSWGGYWCWGGAPTTSSSSQVPRFQLVVRGVSAWGYFCALFVWWLKVGITLCWGHLWWRAPLANRCGSTALACWCFTIVFLFSRLRLPSERPTASVVTSSGSAFLGPAQNLDTYMSWGYFFVWSIFYTFARVTVVQLRTEAAAPAADDEGAPGTTAKYLVCNLLHGLLFMGLLVNLQTCSLRHWGLALWLLPNHLKPRNLAWTFVLGVTFCCWGYLY